MAYCHGSNISPQNPIILECWQDLLDYWIKSTATKVHDVDNDVDVNLVYYVDPYNGGDINSVNTFFKFADEVPVDERETIKSGDSAEVIAQKKKTIDMNKVAPRGIDTSLLKNSYIDLFECKDVDVLLGFCLDRNHFGTYRGFISFDGNGLIIKNLYLVKNTTKQVIFSTLMSNNIASYVPADKIYAKNFSFLNCYINYPGTSETHLFMFRGSKDANNELVALENCKFSVIVNNGYTNMTIFPHDPNNIENLTNRGIYNSSFNIRLINGINCISTMRYQSPYTAPMCNCNIKVYTPSVSRLFDGSASDSSAAFLNCKFLVKATNLKNLYGAMDTKFANCVIDVTDCPNLQDWNPDTLTASASSSTLIVSYREYKLNTNLYNITRSIIKNGKDGKTPEEYLIEVCHFPLLWEDNG